MRRRLAILAGAMLFLSGCWWEGPAFYKGDPADAAPVKPGLYDVALLDETNPTASESVSRGRIEWLPDGSLRWTPTKSDTKVLNIVAVRFPYAGRDIWLTQVMPEAKSENALYGLLERQGDEFRSQPFIECDDTAEIARAAGAKVIGGLVPAPDTEVADVGGEKRPRPTAEKPDPSATPAKPVGQSCLFRKRKSLEKALRVYISMNPRFPARVRFTRVAG